MAGIPELAALAEVAGNLDDVLSSSRYPDVIPAAEVPARYFSEAQAEECVEWAQQISNAVHNLLPNI